MKRRNFLGGLATISLSGMAGNAVSFSKNAFPQAISSPRQLVIRNGHVLTMDPQVGPFPHGNIYINDGEIAAVGPKLKVPDATKEIDARGKIILPGFVETHWHLWNSSMRSLIGSKPGVGYFEMKKMIGPHFRPRDMYAATRFAVAEAINSGITTLHDWNHNIRGPAYAAASLRALKELNIRGRFSQGVAENAGPEIDLQLLNQLHTNWADYGNEGLLHLGLAWAGMTGDKAARRKEVRTAREMGLPISVHADTISSFEDLLDSDFQIIHTMKTSAEAFEKLAEVGASVSSSPFSEMRIGYGLPPVLAMINSGVNIGLSVDTTPLSGNADMFALMKIFMNLANGLAEDQFVVSPNRILEIATIEGARSMGIDSAVGSITPGKRADILFVSTENINMGVTTDPVNLLVLSAQPSNIEAVMVDGQFLKKDGKLVAINVEEIVTEASESLEFLLKESKW